MPGYREKYTPGTIGNLYLLDITLTLFFVRTVFT